MVTHPKKALPGAVPGRKTVLPLSRLGEVYALAACGCTIEEIAQGLGINRLTLQRRRLKVPEFQQAIERGRAEFNASARQGGIAYARQLAAERAARAVEEQQKEAARGRAARAVEEPPKDAYAARLEVEALLREFEPAQGAQALMPHRAHNRQQSPLNETAVSSGGPETPVPADPVPFDDPFAEARDEDGYALPLDDPFRSPY